MKISKVFTFEASHRLPRHEGRCRRLHGHSYSLEVTVEGPVSKESGFVIDYGEIKKVVSPIIEMFDHRHLNCFIQYPSAENIATHVAHLILPYFRMNLPDVNSFEILVRETENTSAMWSSRNVEDWKRLDDPAGEWRSPVVERKELPEVGPAAKNAKQYFEAEIEEAEKEAEAILQKYEDQKTKSVQLGLYLDSLHSVDMVKEIEEAEGMTKQ